MKKLMMVVICALALALCTANAFAQADTLKVDYFANANTAGAPDGTFRIENPGTYSAGAICASIFVFDPTQELSECCSCLMAPDSLLTLSVNGNLTSNPLTGVTLTTGLIKVVSTVPVAGACPLPTTVKPVAAIRAWGVHIQNSNFAETETPSQDATISSGEITALGQECTAISVVGSGKGWCGQNISGCSQY